MSEEPALRSVETDADRRAELGSERSKDVGSVRAGSDLGPLSLRGCHRPCIVTCASQ